MADAGASIFSDEVCELGEGPSYDPESGKLFWFDITGRRLLEKRWPDGAKRNLGSIGLVVTDLCVMDFGGADHHLQVVSLHPGVGFDEVQAATSFTLTRSPQMKETVAPTEEQLAIIRRLDPHDMRASVFKGNPPGVRQPTRAAASVA